MGRHGQDGNRLERDHAWEEFFFKHNTVFASSACLESILPFYLKSKLPNIVFLLCCSEITKNTALVIIFVQPVRDVKLVEFLSLFLRKKYSG